MHRGRGNSRTYTSPNTPPTRSPTPRPLDPKLLEETRMQRVDTERHLNKELYALKELQRRQSQEAESRNS